MNTLNGSLMSIKEEPVLGTQRSMLLEIGTYNMELNVLVPLVFLIAVLVMLAMSSEPPGGPPSSYC